MAISDGNSKKPITTINIQLFGFADVEQYIVLCAELCKIWALIVVYIKATDGDVILILHNRALLMSGSAVMGVQSEQQGDEHTAM